ncbi:MAG TPA: DUF3105 domain-containing protein [Actinomycetota bacterium]|nr:DUF3105 domain-containing protein [Actinomycetota bacterium]
MATKRKRRPRSRPQSNPAAEASAKASGASKTARPTATKRRPAQPPPRRTSTWVRVGAVAAVIALGWLLFYRTTSPGEIPAEARSAAEAAGCANLEQPVIANPSRTHLSPGQSFDYPDRPAAAGPHDPSPLPPDPHVYPDPVPETRAVHNLEHAYVIVYYLPTAQAGPSADVIDRLAALANDEKRVIMAPYPTLTAEQGLALLAWNTRWFCPASVTPEEAVAIARGFIDAYRGTSIAPEAPRGLLGPWLQP